MESGNGNHWRMAGEINTCTLYVYNLTSGNKLHKTLLSVFHLWSCVWTQHCMKVGSKCFSCLKKNLPKSSCTYNYVKVTERLITVTQTGSCGLVKWIIILIMITCFMTVTTRYVIRQLAKSHYLNAWLWFKVRNPNYKRRNLITVSWFIWNLHLQRW